jgi:hypothetical protein
MSAFKSDILDLRVVVHRQTDRAIQVSEHDELSKAVWLPLSQIEMTPAPTKGGMRCADLQIPQWLAEAKGLV